MAASSSDYFTHVGIPGTATTLSAPGHTIGGNSFTVGSTANWSTDTGVIFAVDQIDTNGVRVPNTYTEWEGVVTSSTAVTSCVLRYGNDQDYIAGSSTRVYIPVSSSRENRLVDGLLTSLDNDGTLKAGAVDNTAVLADNIITAAKISTGALSPVKMANPYKFSIYLTTDTSLPSNTWTKALLDTKEFDTGNNADVTTNRRWTAPIAGFYQISAQIAVTTAGSGTGYQSSAIYKNGSAYIYSSAIQASGNGNTINRSSSSRLMQLNAGDYLELYGFHNDGTTRGIAGGINQTFMTGFLVSAT